ncbi:MAG: DUF192 domain-containing protein [Acidobacteria bacterium]|nr:DUF192 domain-containing protein [Acidobacteriota bacterium]
MEKICLINCSKQTVLGEAIELAQTSGERNKGLLGRRGLEPGGGLWIIPTEAIHTFWMKFAIDLVFLDRKRRVTKVVPRLKPFRLAGSWRAHSVVELPAGVAELTGTVAGDQIEKRATPAP